MDQIAQYIIMVLGPSAVWICGWKNKYQRYGYIIGCICQPFWFITLIYNEQYPVLIAAFVYTFAWLTGLWNYWIRPIMNQKYSISSKNK